MTLSTNATSSTSGNYNAGTWTLTPSAASGTGVTNYAITYTPNSGTLDIAQKALTDSGFAVNGKTYNASTTASISSNGSLTNGGRQRPAATASIITNDVVSIASGGSATFNSANVGLRTATGSLTLQGTDDANYTLTAPTASATISARGDHHHRRQPEPDLRLWRHERRRAWARPASGPAAARSDGQRHALPRVTLSTNATELDLREQLQRRHLDHHALERQRLGRGQLQHQRLHAQLRHPQHRAEGAGRTAALR